jgi:hypothetical protein
MNQALQHRIANAVEAMAHRDQRTRGFIPPEDITYLLAPFSPSNPTAPVRT